MSYKSVRRKSDMLSLRAASAKDGDNSLKSLFLDGISGVMLSEQKSLIPESFASEINGFLSDGSVLYTSSKSSKKPILSVHQIRFENIFFRGEAENLHNVQKINVASSEHVEDSKRIYTEFTFSNSESRICSECRLEMRREYCVKVTAFDNTPMKICVTQNTTELFSSTPTPTLYGDSYVSYFTFTAPIFADYRIEISPINISSPLKIKSVYAFEKSALDKAAANIDDIIKSTEFSGSTYVYQKEDNVTKVKHNGNYESFFGYNFFHWGKSLYAFDPIDVKFITVCKDTLEDEQSMFFTIESSLYVFDGKNYFYIDSSLTPKSVSFAVPLLGTITEMGVIYFLDKIELNLLSGHVSFEMDPSSKAEVAIPAAFGYTNYVCVTDMNGNVIDPKTYTYNTNERYGAKLTFSNAIDAKHMVYVEIGTKDLSPGYVFSGKCCCEYSSSGESELKTIVIGAPKKNEGAIALVGMRNGGEIIDDDLKILSNDGHKARRIVKSKNSLVILCDNSIKQMEMYQGESIERARILNLKNDFGCDMPNSAVLADDQLVFGNSLRGIFYSDVYSALDDKRCRYVSRNIDMTDEGFFGLSREERRAAYGVYLDEKYALFAGGKVYVWDIGQSRPTVSPWNLSTEKKMSWYILGREKIIEFLGASGKEICFLGEDADGSVYFSKLSFEKGFSDEAEEAYFHSANINFGDPFSYKTIYSLDMNVRLEENATMKLQFFYDDALSPVECILTSKGEKSPTPYEIRLPQKKCRAFSFSISVSGGNAEFHSMKINYI